MATISVTIPTAQVPRVVDAMCRAGGYTGAPSDTQARNSFAKAMLIDYVKGIVHGVERADADAAALATVNVTDPDVT